MKKAVFIIALCLVAGLIHAQTDSLFRLVRTIKGDIVDFAVDNLDNIYLVDSKNQVKKLNSAGDSVAVFNDVKNYGRASLIDVSNPLKVLLYYKDFATIVILDRFLNVRNTIDLRKQNILQARAIGQSYDNKIWVYDELDNKLKKVDDEGKIMQETPDFRQLFGSILQPQRIFDVDQFVYLYDSTQAVFVFDYYGALKNKILISGWQNFKVANKFIYGSKGAALYRYDIRTFRQDEWLLPPELTQVKSFNFTASRLYALRKDSLEIFSFR
jgi:hypothetical protein